MSNCWKFIKTLLLITLPVCSLSAQDYLEGLKLDGFITQGYFHSDDNNVNGNSEQGSFDFREIAVTSSYRLNERWLIAAQLMSRKAGKVDNGDPRIDFLQLDYRFSEGVSGYSGIRLGRIKNPFGLYNDTRDVAFTRPSIMLSQSIYFDKARDLELSSDGILFYGSYLFDGGQLNSDLVLGVPHSGKSVEYAYLSRDWPGNFSNDIGMMWRNLYTTTDYSWQLGLTLAKFGLDFDGPEVATPPAPKKGSIDIDVMLLSMQYNLERWSFSGEYMLMWLDWETLGGVFALDPKNTTESLYLQAEYRLTPEISFLLRRDILYQDQDDRSGIKSEVLYGKPAHTQFAKDWTVGVAWQPTEEWLLRAEWHKVNGTAWLPLQDNPDLAEMKQHWDLFALQLTYRF